MLTEAHKVLKNLLGIDPYPSFFFFFFKLTQCILLVSQEPNPPGPKPDRWKDAVTAPAQVLCESYFSPYGLIC